MTHQILYNGRTVATERSLSLALGTNVNILRNVAGRLDFHYFQNPPKLKSDGSYRITYRLSDQLKEIQTRIKVHFFHNTHFPLFLTGGIKDKSSPRNIRVNGLRHLHSKLAIKEDIKRFYPSISRTLVFNIWHRLYKMPPSIADLMTELCIYENFVPEGSVTATYLANLCMFEHEPDLAYKLEEIGLVYSRYIDDIHVSSTSAIPKSSLTYACASIYGLLRHYSFKPHRKAPKHIISTNPKDRLVNSQRLVNDDLILPKRYRNQVRQDVRYLLKAKAEGRTNEAFRNLGRSTIGKIQRIKIYHPQTAESLYKQLQEQGIPQLIRQR